MKVAGKNKFTIQVISINDSYTSSRIDAIKAFRTILAVNKNKCDREIVTGLDETLRGVDSWFESKEDELEKALKDKIVIGLTSPVKKVREIPNKLVNYIRIVSDPFMAL